MEQQIGSLGSITESYAAGVVSAAGSLAIPPTSFGLGGSVQLSLTLSAPLLIAYLASKIGGAVPADVATFIEAALKAS